MIRFIFGLIKTECNMRIFIWECLLRSTNNINQYADPRIQQFNVVSLNVRTRPQNQPNAEKCVCQIVRHDSLLITAYEQLHAIATCIKWEMITSKLFTTENIWLLGRWRIQPFKSTCATHVHHNFDYTNPSELATPEGWLDAARPVPFGKSEVG